MISNVILDLDNTLICSLTEEEIRRLPPDKHRAVFSKLTYHKDGDLFVFERPYLQPFLDVLFYNFANVSVWTAASKNYATYVVDSIFHDRPLDYILFWHHCNESMGHTGNMKDLNVLKRHFRMRNYDIESTLIIDDNDDVARTQPMRTLHVKPPFDIQKMVHPELDTYLLNVAIPTLKLMTGRYIK